MNDAVENHTMELATGQAETIPDCLILAYRLLMNLPEARKDIEHFLAYIECKHTSAMDRMDAPLKYEDDIMTQIIDHGYNAYEVIGADEPTLNGVYYSDPRPQPANVHSLYVHTDKDQIITYLVQVRHGARYQWQIVNADNRALYWNDYTELPSQNDNFTMPHKAQNASHRVPTVLALKGKLPDAVIYFLYIIYFCDSNLSMQEHLNDKIARVLLQNKNLNLLYTVVKICILLYDAQYYADPVAKLNILQNRIPTVYSDFKARESWRSKVEDVRYEPKTTYDHASATEYMNNILILQMENTREMLTTHIQSNTAAQDAPDSDDEIREYRLRLTLPSL